MAETLTGACLCGAVRLEIDGPLESAGYCHCTRCQRRTGTGSSAGARVRHGALRVVAGRDHVTTWTPPDGFAKSFCAICGGHLFSHDPADPAVASVRLGIIDGDPGIRPQYRMHVASAAVWERIPDDGLPRFERARA